MAYEFIFKFFPILAVILHFFGLESKSVHSPTHPYAIHCWKQGWLERSDPVLFYRLGESLRTLQE
jgi:hypothetical protein